MQTMMAIASNGRVQLLRLPPPEAIVMPGVQWGRLDEFFTPAFWRAHAWQHELRGAYRDFRLGRTLREETAACLLGGHGMPAELGLAAHRRLRDRGMLAEDATPTEEEFETALGEPFMIMGRPRHYRFPRQKARYLAACLRALRRFEEPEDDRALRHCLAAMPGIGPKTASWIVRNHRGSDVVAIIDVHIVRAGRLAGFYAPGTTTVIDYPALEAGFLAFASAIATAPSLLDNVIWNYMRQMSWCLRRAAGTEPPQI